MTKYDFIEMVVKNKNGWLSGYFWVEGVEVGIKSYGLWVQQIEAMGCRDTIPEQKTQRALREKLKNYLDSLR